MKKFVLLLTVCLAFSSLAVGVFAAASPTPAAIGITLQNPLCPGGAGSANCTNDFPTLLGNIKNFFLGIVAVLSSIMFVWAGILFVTSAGDPGKSGKAKEALWWAVIGLAVVLAAAGLYEVIKAVIGPVPT